VIFPTGFVGEAFRRPRGLLRGSQKKRPGSGGKIRSPKPFGMVVFFQPRLQSIRAIAAILDARSRSVRRLRSSPRPEHPRRVRKSDLRATETSPRADEPISRCRFGCMLPVKSQEWCSRPIKVSLGLRLDRGHLMLLSCCHTRYVVAHSECSPLL